MENIDYKQAAEDYAIQKHKSMVYMQAHQAKESFIAGCEFASAPLLEQIEKQQAQIKELTAEFDKVIMGNINYGALRLELQSMKTELKKVEEWESVKEVDRLKRELITKQEEINKNKEAYDLAMSFEKAGWYKDEEFERLTKRLSNATNRTLEEAFNAGRSTVIPTKQLQMVISFDFKDFEQWDKMRQGQATSELEKLKR